jgi:hypothetical protein
LDLFQPLPVPGFSALTIEDELRLALAAAVEVKSPSVPDETIDRDAVNELANVVVMDINEVAGTGADQTGEGAGKFLDYFDSVSVMRMDPKLEGNETSVYRIALASMGLALADFPLPANVESARPQPIKGNEEAVLRISVATVRQAIAGVDRTALRKALREASTPGEMGLP